MNISDEVRRSLTTQYKFLGSFGFTSICDSPNQGEFALTMDDRNGECLRLLFYGVRNLEIRTGPYDKINFAGLSINDMRSDQWPDVNFNVISEDESTYLSFYCADAVVI